MEQSERQKMILQGLESIVKRVKQVEKWDVLHEIGLETELLSFYRNLARSVVCMDTNHNSDYGIPCTNPSCFNYIKEAKDGTN